MDSIYKTISKQNRRITQHKRFVPYGTHPNFYFAKTSFMLETLIHLPNKNQVQKLKNSVQ